MDLFLAVAVAALVSLAFGHASRFVVLRYGTWSRIACNFVGITPMILLLDHPRWVPVAFAIGGGYVVGSMFPPLTPLRPVPEDEPAGPAETPGPA